MSIVSVGDSHPRPMRRPLPASAYFAIGCVIFVLTAALVRPESDDGTKDVIRARSFVLVDDDGRERAELTVTEDGSARLLFRDKDGVRGPWIGFRSDGVQALTLTDADGFSYLELRVNDGLPAVILYGDKAGENRRRRAELSVDKDGAASLRLMDAAGQVVTRVTSRTDGTGDITLFSGAKMKASIWLGDDGKARVGLFDGRKKPRMTMGFGTDGTPVLTRWNAKGEVIRP